MKKIVLASASPARKALLEQIGLDFIVDKSDYEEDMTKPLEPHELVMELARGKAEDVAKRYEDAIVIGSDLVIALAGEVLGKPHTKERAVEMLGKMNGREHSVITGFCIIDTASGKSLSDFGESIVHFGNLSEDEIKLYVEKEMPLAKAGSYSIQDLGVILVEKIEGEYTNIVGLPLTKLSKALKEFGVDVL